MTWGGSLSRLDRRPLLHMDLLAGDFPTGALFEGAFFGATFLAEEGFLVGFVDFFRGFLGTARFGVDLARVCPFDFLEPAMVAISPRGSLADPHDHRVNFPEGVPPTLPGEASPPVYERGPGSGSKLNRCR